MYSIEAAEFTRFCTTFFKANQQQKRFGQAFFDHFKLGRMNNTTLTDKIYNAASTEDAMKLIHQNFILE